MSGDGRTITALDDAEATAREPVLVIIGTRGVERRALPQHGRVIIGRGDDADVVIAEASMSRRHAAIELGDTLAIEDLGSANGTSVRSRRITERVSLGWGEPVQLSSTTVIVMRNRARLPAAPPPGGPVFADARMQRVVQVVERVARGDLGVLLSGETGTGKEVLAELLHVRSPRAGGPFVKINCAALPDGLIEAELFGHERGAFTGATASRRGLIEEAHGGTLFLDEVGELSAAGQAKLLRVLEDRAVRPIGGRAPIPVDVRVVAASHRDLRGDSFRRDLYFRLAGIVIAVPPLRERPADVLPLAEHLLARGAASSGRDVPTLGPAARAWLTAQTWPGNVRELRNAVDRALLLCDGPEIAIAHLAGESDSPATNPAEELPANELRDVIATVERERIHAVLRDHDWNQSAAARVLGMTRNTLAARIRTYGLRR